MCYSVCDACLLPPMRDSRRAPHGIAKVRQKHKIRASVRGFVVVSATLYPTMVRLRGFSDREGWALPSDFRPFWAMLFSGETFPPGDAWGNGLVGLSSCTFPPFEIGLKIKRSGLSSRMRPASGFWAKLLEATHLPVCFLKHWTGWCFTLPIHHLQHQFERWGRKEVRWSL